MAFGPLARLVAQLTIAVGGALARAVLKAYKDAAQQGHHNKVVSKTFLRRMSVDEASRILEVDTARITQEDVNTRFARLYEINTPSENFGGSPYLQKKVESAKTIIEEDVLKIKKPPSSESPTKSSFSATSSKSSNTQSQFSSLCFPFLTRLGSHNKESSSFVTTPSSTSEDAVNTLTSRLRTPPSACGISREAVMLATCLSVNLSHFSTNTAIERSHLQSSSC